VLPEPWLAAFHASFVRSFVEPSFRTSLGSIQSAQSQLMPSSSENDQIQLLRAFQRYIDRYQTPQARAGEFGALIDRISG
jgi:hypothetical protein